MTFGAARAELDSRIVARQEIARRMGRFLCMLCYNVSDKAALSSGDVDVTAVRQGLS